MKPQRNVLQRRAKTQANKMFVRFAAMLHPIKCRRDRMEEEKEKENLAMTENFPCLPYLPCLDDKSLQLHSPPIFTGTFSTVWTATRNDRRLVVKFNTNDIGHQEFAILDYMRLAPAKRSLHLLYMDSFCHDSTSRIGLIFDRALCDFGHIKLAQFSFKRVVEIATSVFCGLSALHTTYNLVHTDLKPQNIFIFADSVKIADFGHAIFSKPSSIMPFARSCIAQCTGNIEITSREFRAPEIYLGAPLNEKIDVWSAGAFVFYLITHGHFVYANQHISHSTFLAEISQLFDQKDDDFLGKCVYRHRYLLAAEEAAEEASAKNINAETITKRIARLSCYPEGLEKMSDFWDKVFSIQQRPTAREMMTILFRVL